MVALIGTRAYSLLADEPLGPMIMHGMIAPVAWVAIGNGIADFALGIPIAHKDRRAVEALQSVAVGPLLRPDTRGGQVSLRF